MTAPQPDPTEPTPAESDPDAEVDLFDPSTHPHPLRAQDATALLAKEIG